MSIFLIIFFVLFGGGLVYLLWKTRDYRHKIAERLEELREIRNVRGKQSRHMNGHATHGNKWPWEK